MRNIELLAIVTFVTLVSLTAKANEIPQDIEDHITSDLPGYSIFNGVLKKFGSSHISNAKPWFVIQDFNGDSKADWIGLLAKEIPKGSNFARNFSHDLDIFCICSESEGYTSILISRHGPYVAKDDNSVSFSISLRRPGFYVSPVDQGGQAVIEFYGAEMTDYEKSRYIYFWNGEKFDRIFMSD